MTRAFVAALLVTGCNAGDDVRSPVIATIQPDPAIAGTSVTISGTFFCAQPQSDDPEVDPLACEHMGTLAFGSAATTYGQYTDTSIVADVPSLPAGDVTVRLSVAGRTSNGYTFTVE